MRRSLFKGLLVFLGLFATVASETSAEELPSHRRQEGDKLLIVAGELYAQGKYAEAIESYRQAADRGNAWGQNNLAWLSPH